MITQILIGLGSALAALLIACIVGTFTCVKKIQKLYDELEDIDPENWEDKEDK